MVRTKKQEALHTRNVQPLNNDYVRSNPQAKSQYKAKQAVLRRRRMAIFFIFAVIVIAGLIQANKVQNERLTEKVEQKANVSEELEQALENQEMLKLQIAKLEDDEYIAKLARKEFFLSEEGEIIFTMPSSSEEKDEKDSEDEQ
ncbi:septum formation initiator [Lysinibacillus sp. 2017]|uniref:FtsB family cell division protein n=1 Tax=unclassified Lysinibacillus TaxID=2636778 RepID=UPI000D5264CF|nr:MULTISPECIES: septum formation initiator family protein [unclassified Lysinibacillus]AWE05963.1 septum formation initiator [Lysinibacillus sp. 2017]TGN33457.1 septum formation initiator [Lysinibacillus sp. S2017]